MIYERWSWGKSERGRIFSEAGAEGSPLVVENLELPVAGALGPLQIDGGGIYERVRRISCYAALREILRISFSEMEYFLCRQETAMRTKIPSSGTQRLIR